MIHYAIFVHNIIESIILTRKMKVTGNFQIFGILLVRFRGSPMGNTWAFGVIMMQYIRSHFVKPFL